MPFPAYKGDEPYAFVCYSHGDKDVVYPEIAWLQEQGVNVWYDEGISAGRVWRAEIGEAIEKCTSILFYVSRSSLTSSHCNREISLGLDEEQAILPIYLEDVALTSDLKVGLARVQALNRVEDDDYQRHLLEALGRATVVDTDLPSRKQSKPLAKYATVLGLILVLGGTGWWYLQNQRIERPDSAEVVVAVAKPTIAVLPFDNLSADAEQEYFSDGVAEDILNGLAHSPDVVVRARNSSFSFKGQLVDTRTIAERLNVTHIVNGSVRTAGNRIRVNARLTSVEEDVEVWSDRYDAQLEDVFAVQDEVTGSILEALNVHFSKSEKQRVSLDAYNAFLLGRYHINRFEADKAIAALEDAIEIEPEYAEALASLAQIYGIREWLGAYVGIDNQANLRDKQRAYLERALTIDPDEPNVRGAQALDRSLRMSLHQDAINELDRLIRQYPNNRDILFYYSAVLRFIGRSDLEIRVFDQEAALDPLDPGTLGNRAGAKLFAGRYEEAMKDNEAAERLGISAPLWVAMYAFYRRDIEALEAQVERDPVAWIILPQTQTIMAAAVSYLRGDSVGVQQTLSTLGANGSYVSSLAEWWIALLKGKNELALEHFRAALREGEPQAFYEIQGSHVHRSIFPDYFAQPGYEAMLREFHLDSASVGKLAIPDLPF